METISLRHTMKLSAQNVAFRLTLSLSATPYGSGNISNFSSLSTMANSQTAQAQKDPMAPQTTWRAYTHTTTTRILPGFTRWRWAATRVDTLHQRAQRLLDERRCQSNRTTGEVRTCDVTKGGTAAVDSKVAIAIVARNHRIAVPKDRRTGTPNRQ